MAGRRAGELYSSLFLTSRGKGTRLVRAPLGCATSWNGPTEDAPIGPSTPAALLVGTTLGAILTPARLEEP